jgi:hypothetical protein
MIWLGIVRLLSSFAFIVFHFVSDFSGVPGGT